MAYWTGLTLWLTSIGTLALGLIWTAAAEDQPLATASYLPDNVPQVDKNVSFSPTPYSSAGPGPGADKSLDDVVPAQTVPIAVTVGAPSVVVPIALTSPPELIPETQRSSVNSPVLATSVSMATPPRMTTPPAPPTPPPAPPTPPPAPTTPPPAPTTPPPTPPQSPMETPSPIPNVQLTPSPNTPSALPPEDPTLIPSYLSTGSVETAANNEDKDKQEEGGLTTEPGNKTVVEEDLCDFDPCEHLQRPCPEIRELMGRQCRCPGPTHDPLMTPEPVVALKVIGVWAKVASIQWCAPYSALSDFLIWVLRQDGTTVSNGSVSSWTRQTNVFGLEPKHEYIVCVSAKNAVGVSRKRCVPVSTPPDGEAIALYILIGMSTALLLTAVVLSVCLHRQCRKDQVTTHTPTDLSPPIQTLHDPRVTSVVSIPNPAYTNNDEPIAPPAVNTLYAQTEPRKKSNVRKK